MASRAAAKTPKLAALSQTPRVLRFFQRHLRHPMKGRWAGQPFTPEPFQRDEIIDPIFGTIDPKTGLRVVTDALIGMARKSGKTTVAAGAGLYLTFADGHWDPKSGDWIPEWGAEVYSVAPSKTQAHLVFDPAKQMVEGSPYLRAAARVYKDAIEVRETGAVYRVIASAGDLAHGFNPSAIIADEVHALRTAAHRELWAAITTGGGAREQPLLLAITTAGYDRATILYELYKRGKGRHPRSFYFRWWGAPDGCKIDDPKAFKAANPASWITAKYLRAQLAKPGMHPSVFRRLHLNQWTGSAERWISQEEWDACSAKPKIEPGAPVYVAVDSAPKRDTTAVVVVHRDDAGAHHVLVQGWEADRTMGYVDFVQLEDFLRELCTVYDVQRILVDPYAMQRTMMVLAGEGLPVEEFPQQDAYMVPASQNLYDLVLERRFRHGGDQRLQAHSDNAAAVETARGWRLHKLRSTGPIDSLIAAAIACQVAEQDAQAPAFDPDIRVLSLD